MFSFENFKKSFSEIVNKSNDVCGAYENVRNNLSFLIHLASKVVVDYDNHMLVKYQYAKLVAPQELRHNISKIEKQKIIKDMKEFIQHNLARHSLCKSNYGDDRDFWEEGVVLSNTIVDTIADCCFQDIYKFKVISLENQIALYITKKYRMCSNSEPIPRFLKQILKQNKY